MVSNVMVMFVTIWPRTGRTVVVAAGFVGEDVRDAHEGAAGGLALNR